jgi:RNA ligase
MQYNFPEIRTINDVLPHIEGRSEFIVAEREFGTVINYVVAMADTFNMDGPNDIGGAIRRECRGIKFGLDGNIIARPFHKFFNVGEREETLQSNLDFSADHSVLTKLDGSMSHPIIFDGEVRWCTKMGLTEIAEYMDKFAERNPKYNSFARECFAEGYTPLFEYVGPHNKVVLDYKEENMILLAVRHMITGEYIKIN